MQTQSASNPYQALGLGGRYRDGLCRSCATAYRAAGPQDVAVPQDKRNGGCASREGQSVKRPLTSFSHASVAVSGWRMGLGQLAYVRPVGSNSGREHLTSRLRPPESSAPCQIVDWRAGQDPVANWSSWSISRPLTVPETRATGASQRHRVSNGIRHATLFASSQRPLRCSATQANLPEEASRRMVASLGHQRDPESNVPECGKPSLSTTSPPQTRHCSERAVPGGPADRPPPPRPVPRSPWRPPLP